MRLFRPAWDSKNGYRAEKAVWKITDEAKLERIAKEARSLEARLAAIEGVTNQSLLADIAQNDKEYNFVRIAAIGRVNNPSILIAIAQNNEEHCDVRIAAIERVANQNLLADIARNDKAHGVRMAAVERVTAQSLLADIAQNGTADREIRIAASLQLVDYDLEEYLLMYIIQMLGDVLKDSRDEVKRRKAAEVLLVYYQRYGKGKYGEAIRQYEGEYKGIGGWHSDGDYRDGEHTDESWEHSDGYCCGDMHTDKSFDDTYTITFNPEEA